MRDAAETLERELRWFYAVLEARLRAHFAAADAPPAKDPPGPPDLARAAGPYAALLRTHGFGAEERLVLALALAPHVRPALLDPLFTRNSTYDRPFSEFGGLGQPGGAFTPSVETALFLLAGDSLADRLRAARFFAAEHPFQRAGLLDLGPADPALTPAQRPLRPAPAALHTLLTGEPWRPRFGLQFPARRLTTERTWDDLVLTPDTREQLDDILAWLRHGDTILRGWGLGKKLRPGWRALFVGQPGTGKTFTATLLGQAAGRDVYRVDLSMVISKYIGETEKNLEAVFSQAEDRDWILFFDEADALFGRRTQVKDAHDRFANQEVSYLLQRVEEFPGVVVLATNFRDNLDDAFLRRFESVVQFPLPGPEELHVLWRHGLAGVGELAPDVDLAGLARRHRLSGGAVMNVVRFCALRAVRRERPVVRLRDLEDGLRRELQKEGRSC
jgi:hypothetical protein